MIYWIKTFLFRFFFWSFIFLVVLLLVFQMFLPVIIDYFNETREKSETFNDTMKTECIVCGINREEIEKTTPNEKKAFDKHFTNCYNVFNYIYYLMYLHSIQVEMLLLMMVFGIYIWIKICLVYLKINFLKIQKKDWKNII